jgi:hypothetical protein
MRRMARLAATLSAIALGLVSLASPVAHATGDPVGGSGYKFFLNDAFTGTANTVFYYDSPGNQLFTGDWDGDGVDTLMGRLSQIYYVRADNTTGSSQQIFNYGNWNDIALVGDWDGDGADTVAVRRGNTFYIRNSLTTGVADMVFSYGDPGDTVLVGDWDGDGDDTLAVRRGGQYFVKNDLRTGVADTVFSYGNPDDTVLVGHWSLAQVGDTLGVRRGGTYYLRNSLTSGVADREFGYGNRDDTVMVGDWDADGVDTLGVRRPLAPSLSGYVPLLVGRAASFPVSQSVPGFQVSVADLDYDPTCTSPFVGTPASGHYLVLSVDAWANTSPLTVDPRDFHVVSPSGVAQSGTEVMVGVCRPTEDWLTSQPLTPGMRDSGVILLDTALTSGYITWTPPQTATGWAWQF